MSREVFSAARPTPLRLVGFVTLAAGAAAAGIGATREWAAIGFPGDRLGAADVSVRGTDVWEGKVVLLGAAVALFALLAMRLAGSEAIRRGLALLVVAVGLVTLALPIVDAARAEDRFGGEPGFDRYVEALAARAGLPEDVVRQQLAEQFEADLRVDVGPGLWVTAAGGLLLLAGGVLGAAWARRRAAPGADPDPDPPA